ncbi:uncharacterized protein LOC130614019 isoform X3 [Hydractinia symbiolongicarpus]|uniref:uncharacterized protein LOC130614019 isoform X3 n=1 Tax=Hydractinia symbiolongicarpus TaxID=13093 RepID=UPI00254BA88B|nr:uncharacterized protein LOC130614019 isoform X3 [Hydractinia symbiolongicarpus]XP_057291387.1 uncharacterized protein LOC130614019 isoform X3 [Hydractinia symbiolongicarpus]XP_057291388.1 uncharacterized protein LOC130614019 isoform X3 [Hydractinia symbiolongicarpus]
MAFLGDIKSFDRSSLSSAETIVTKHNGRKIKESVSGEELSLNCPELDDACFSEFFVFDASPDKNLHKVCKGLFIGSQDASANLEELQASGITHILNVAVYTENHYPKLFTYKNVSMYDVPSYDISEHFEDCSKFIENAITSNGSVLCHCNAGISRSSTVIMAYLMKYKNMTLDDALELVQKARPIAMPNIGFLVKLQEYGLKLK